MFSGLGGEKALLRPFVFKKFSGLRACAVLGHKVAMQAVEVRLVRCGIINPFLLRVPGDEAQGRARSCGGALPVPITARASRE
jgi:hypothetical protein